MAAFRALFGDERADYANALKMHYAQGALPGWQALYLHIIDTLETARAFGMSVATRKTPRGSISIPTGRRTWRS